MLLSLAIWVSPGISLWDQSFGHLKALFHCLAAKAGLHAEDRG